MNSPWHYNEELAHERRSMLDETAGLLGELVLFEPSDTPLQKEYHQALGRLVVEYDDVEQTMRGRYSAAMGELLALVA